MKRRFLSTLMALVLALSLVPTAAFAAEETLTVSSVEELQTAAENSENSGKTIVIDTSLEFTHATETINVAAGVTVTSNSGVTITIDESENTADQAAKYYFTLAEGAVLDGLTVQLTNDDEFETDIVSMTGTGSEVKNCSFSGVYEVSENPAIVSRAIVMNAGLTDWKITGNTFTNLRQPGYIEGTGTISGNTVTGTRGWVVCMNHETTIEDNTFSNNAVDIAIIENGQSYNKYAGQAASLSENNYGAYVQDQRAKAEAEDGVLVVGREGSDAAYTLQAAIDAASAGDTVKLLDNVALTDGVEVDKTLTLDLNGHTISNSDNWTDDTTVDYLVAVKRGGDLTIEDREGNGAITTENLACGVKMTIKGEGETGTSAKLTVNGGTIQGCYYGISGNGTRHNTEITINDGVIQDGGEGGTAIYQPQNGTLTIHGGTIQSSNTAIEIRSGSLTVTGGTITGGTEEPVVSENGSGTTTSNTGIAVAQHATKEPITVNITGGTITGGAAVYESNPQNNDKTNAVTVSITDADLKGDLRSTGFGNVSVNNATIDGDVSKGTSGNMGIVDSTITGNVPTGTNVTLVNCVDENDNPISGTVPEGAVAMVNGQSFNDLQDALNAATSGDTVYLVNDIKNITLTGDGSYTQAYSIETDGITLDGRGHQITAETKTGDGHVHVLGIGGDNVIIKNLIIDGGTVSRSGINVFQAKNVVLENVTSKNNSASGVTVNGSSVTADGLYTSENGWGNRGVDVDPKANDAGASFTLRGSDSNIGHIYVTNTYTGSEAEVAVEAGYVVGIFEAGNNNEGTDISVTGGSFGSSVLQYSDKSYEVKSGTGVFTYYATGTEAASAAASNGGTITEVKEGVSASVVAPASNGTTFTVVDSITVTAPNGYYLTSRNNGDGTVTYTVYREATGTSGGSSEPSYSPVLDISDGGTVKVNPRTPSEGDEVTITVDPDRGYEVGDVTVTDRNGREVDVTAGRNGTYTFEQPRGRVTIEVTFVPTGTVTFFTDVPESFWAYDEIKWAYDNGYVNGTTATTFSPNGSITRQQVWMILARLSGADPANMAAARTWAIDNGISDGTNPGSAVTRQQLVALLYRYATLMGYANDARADLSVYPDAGTVASYAVEPMQWSVANNIVAGTSDGILNPTGTATRAQFAVILYRFMA